MNALYGQVARDIEAPIATKHGNPAASELRRRYRMIQIQNATAMTRARCLGATSTLNKLREDALAKQKVTAA